MNKILDKIGIVTNIVLLIVYIPIMLFGFLAGGMACEALLDMPEHTILQEILIEHIPGILGFLIGPGFTVFCLLYSARLRNIGKSVASFLIQFAPLVFYALFTIYIALIP